MEIYTIEAILLVFLILITCAVIFCKDILSAAIIYSAFSFCAVLLYLMMGSPDVAFTEAVIGTISTIFFVASLKKIDAWTGSGTSVGHDGALRLGSHLSSGDRGSEYGTEYACHTDLYLTQ